MNLHGPVRVADFEGSAELNLSFDAWTGTKVLPSRYTLTVLPGRKEVPVVPATERIVRTLIHPDRDSTISVLRMNGDGTRLIGSGYPSGTVQVWDWRTGAEVSRAQGPTGFRTTADYALPTPDFKTLIIHNRTRKLVREEKDGKVIDRVQVDGQIDLLDLSSGKRRQTISIPNGGPTQAFLAPDGNLLFLNQEGTFQATDRERPTFLSVLDLSTGQTKRLLEAQGTPVFTPDGRSAIVAAGRYFSTGKFESSLHRIDLARREIAKTRLPAENHELTGPRLSPDGKRLVVLSSRREKQSHTDQVVLLLDSTTFEEQLRFPVAVPKDDPYIEGLDFVADGTKLVFRMGGKLHFWDIASRKETSIALPEIGHHRTSTSPDRKWMAILAWPKIDLQAMRDETSPLQFPQARLHLIRLDDPKKPIVSLTMPHGFLGDVLFPLDGRHVIVGQSGGAHVIELPNG